MTGTLAGVVVGRVHDTAATVRACAARRDDGSFCRQPAITSAVLAIGQHPVPLCFACAGTPVLPSRAPE